MNSAARQIAETTVPAHRLPRRRGVQRAGLSAGLLALFLAPPAAADDIAPLPADPLRAALFDEATFTLHGRSFFSDTDGEVVGDAAAMAIGGWVGYQSGWLADTLQIGARAYTSQPLWAPEDQAGTLLLLPDGDAINTLGIAYAALRHEGQTLTLYRQEVNQPEVNPHDNCMVPITFEGASLAGGIDAISYYAGYLTQTKLRNANHFVTMSQAAGVKQDEPMYLGTLTYAEGKPDTARTSLYVVPNILVSSYTDGTWTHELDDENTLSLSSQFMIQTSIGEALLTGDDFHSWVFGIMGTLDRGGLSLSAGYTVTSAEAGWQSPFGNWPGYSNLLIGLFDRAGEQTLMLNAGYDFSHAGLPGFEVNVFTAFDTAVADGQPMWQEYDFIANYSFSAIGTMPPWLSPLSISAGYGMLRSDQSGGGDGINNKLQLILNYDITKRGSAI